MKNFFFGALLLLCAGFLAVAQDVPVYDGEGADFDVYVYGKKRLAKIRKGHAKIFARQNYDGG